MISNQSTYKHVSQLNEIVIASDEFMQTFNGIQKYAEHSIAYKEPIGSMLLAKGGLRV